MKVSAVKVALTEKDILDIVHEFIHVEGLAINNIEVGELITVYGSYKKGVAVPFKVNVGIGNIHNNIINVKVMNVNVAKLGILKVVKNIALKAFLNDFSENGIEVEGDNITINLNTIIRVIPSVNFKLLGVKIIKGGIEAEVEDFMYVPDKKVDTLGKDKERKRYVHLDDNYSKLRKNINEKIPDKYNNVMEYAMIIPDIVALFWRLFRDKRVSLKVKLLIIGIVGYLASPIDLALEFIPFVGQINSLAVVFFGLQKIIEEVPKDIILQNWQGKEDIILKSNEVINYLYKILGSKNVAKLLAFLKKLPKKAEENVEEHEEGRDIH